MRKTHTCHFALDMAEGGCDAREFAPVIRDRSAHRSGIASTRLHGAVGKRAEHSVLAGTVQKSGWTWMYVNFRDQISDTKD
ncbi:hypothetical protein ACIRRA_28495 [Nocardia sp. NPDC101769]|uniref:hypothetical protein n=1 Tax=Nocardia sp. NPDC101769 TaxID=3364333 RepID=UPI003801EA1D